MKRLAAIFSLPVLAVAALLSFGAASPLTWDVRVLTNGVIYRPTNFWTANSTNIVTAIQGQIATGQVELAFSSDFIISNQTNVALVASNLYSSIAALNTASTNLATNIINSTNTLYSGVTAQITAATNTLWTSTTNYVKASTNTVTTNLQAQITSATNTLLTAVSNTFTGYSSNLLSGFTLSGIPLSSGPLTNVAHGLGAEPIFVSCVLVCRTNDAGYVVGDRISVDAVEGSGDERALLVGANATNIFLIQRNDAVIKSLNKTTGANGALDAPSWTATIYGGR